MELLIVLALLLLLAVAAPRWGYDSRATLASPEQHLAALGLSWAADHRDSRPARHRT